jgi:putative hydrolase of the HAD superfamily
MNTKKYTDIKGVFFDLGWTLEGPFNGDWMFTNRFREVCNPQDFDSIARSEIIGALDELSKYLQQNHKMNTAEEEFRQFTTFYEILGKKFPQLGITHEKAEDIAHDRTYNMENYVLFEDTVTTLKALRERGMKLGVISDTWPDVILQLRHFNIIDYFDSLTFSYELGVFKPDSALFKDALNKIKLPAEQTVFVDDMAYILEGAQKHGINPIQSLAQPEKQGDSRFPSVTKPSDVLNLV